MSAVGYVRLSPGERAAGGLGLEAQREAIRALAKRLGLELRSIHEDGRKSGGRSIDARPGLVAALGELEEGDVLLVAKIDRLSRGDRIQEFLVEQAVKERGASVRSAAGEGTDGDSPTDVLMRRIVAAFAEYERLMISLRTKAALAVKRGRGERTGAVPFGWRDEGGRLVEVPEQRRAIALMRRLRAAGSSFREICAELARRAIPTQNGGPWQAATVRRILLSTR